MRHLMDFVYKFVTSYPDGKAFKGRTVDNLPVAKRRRTIRLPMDALNYLIQMLLMMNSPQSSEN
jgi:hypothetical protein